MNVFFCDIVGTFNGYEENIKLRKEKIKILVDKLIELSDNQILYFNFISGDNYLFVKRYIDEIQEYIKDTNIILDTNYCYNQIYKNNTLYNNPYLCKWEQIYSYVEDNPNINRIYFAEDSIINLQMTEELLNEEHKNIELIQFIPGLEINEYNIVGSKEKGIDSLINILTKYINNLKKNNNNNNIQKKL